MRIVLGLAMSLALTAQAEPYSYFAKNTAALAGKSTTALVSDTPFLFTAGFGYDIDRARIKAGTCIDGSYTYLGAQQGTLEASMDTTVEQFQRQMGGSVSGGFSLGSAFSGSSSSSFSSQFKQDSFSTSVLLHAVVVAKTIVYKPSMKGAASGVDTTNPATFREACGTHWVAQVPRGAEFWALARFDFDSEQSRKEFSASSSASAAFGIFSGNASASMKGMTFSSKQKSRLTIFAYQVGGKPEQLMAILGDSNNDGLADPLTCTLDKLDSCNTTMNALLKYGESFKAQFPAESDMAELVSKVDDSLLRPYSEANIHVSWSPLWTTAGRSYMTRLADGSYSLRRHYGVVNDWVIKYYGQKFLDPNFKKPSEDIIKLDDVRSRIFFNQQTVDQAGAACYANPQNCETIAKEAEAKLRYYNQAPFEWQNWTLPADYGYDEGYLTCRNPTFPDPMPPCDGSPGSGPAGGYFPPSWLLTRGELYFGDPSGGPAPGVVYWTVSQKHVIRYRSFGDGSYCVHSGGSSLPSYTSTTKMVRTSYDITKKQMLVGTCKLSGGVY